MRHETRHIGYQHVCSRRGAGAALARAPPRTAAPPRAPGLRARPSEARAQPDAQHLVRLTMQFARKACTVEWQLTGGRAAPLLAGERCHGPLSPLGAAAAAIAARLPGRFPARPKCKAPGGQHTHGGARAGPRSTATPCGLTPGAPSPPDRPHGARAALRRARRAAPATRAGARCCASAPFCCSCRPARGPATGAVSTRMSARSRRSTTRAHPRVGRRPRRHGLSDRERGGVGRSRSAAIGAPSGTGFTAIFSTTRSRRSTTRAASGGGAQRLGRRDTGAPSGTGFTAIFSTGRSRRSTTRAPSTRGASARWQRRAERHGLHRDLLDGHVRGARRRGPHPRVGHSEIVQHRRAERHGLHRDLLDDTTRSRRSTTRAASTRGATATRRRRRAERHGLHRDLLDGGAFAALDDQGRIHAWGHSDLRRQRRPSGTGFTALFSTGGVRGARRPGRHPRVGRQRLGRRGARRAARASPRSSRRTTRSRRSTTRARIHAWGSGEGGSGAPNGTGFVAIFSTGTAFAALDDQGAIHARQRRKRTRRAARASSPAIFSTFCAFAALDDEGRHPRRLVAPPPPHAAALCFSPMCASAT